MLQAVLEVGEIDESRRIFTDGYASERCRVAAVSGAARARPRYVAPAAVASRRAVF